MLRSCCTSPSRNAVLADVGVSGDNSLVHVDFCEGDGEVVEGEDEREESRSIWESRCFTTDKWSRFAMEGLLERERAVDDR